MRLRLFIVVLLAPNLQSPCEATVTPSQNGAGHQAPNTTGFTVEYTLITVDSPDCESSLVNSFPVRVQYRRVSDGDGELSNISVSEWMDPPNDINIVPEISNTTDCEANLNTSVSDMPVRVTVRSYSLPLPSDIDHINSSQRIQLRLVQSDHQGGFCDCWAVSSLGISLVTSSSNLDITLMKTCDSNGMNYTSLTDFLGAFALYDNETIMCMNQTLISINTSDSILGFCQGSASVPRGFVSVELGAEAQSQCENTAAVVDTGRAAPLMGDQCDSLPHVRVNFNILFSSRNILETFDEGVEFGFQNLNGGREWIPLAFYSFQRPNRRDNDIKLAPELTLSDNVATIRGYGVFIYYVGGTIVHRAELNLCGSEIVCNNALLQFRWLQTVVSSSDPNTDPVYLDNVTISINSIQQQHVLFQDDFNSGMTINSTRWTEVQHVTLECQNGPDCHLQFGVMAPTFAPLLRVNSIPLTIISRGISTVYLRPNFTAETTIINTTTTELPTTNLAKTDLTDTDEVTSTPVLANEDVSMSSEENQVLDYIKENQKFSNIYDLSQNGSLIAVLMNLNYVILNTTMERINSEPEDLTAAAYLLSTTVSGLGSQTVEPTISEIMLSTASGFLDVAQRQRGSEVKDMQSLELQYIVGSTLLKSMDEFALNNHNTSHSVTSDNIVFLVEEIPALANETTELTPFLGEDVKIIIPLKEVLAGLESGAEVRMAALLFRNMSGLLPESIDYEESESDNLVLRLASPVVSASFQCDPCTISNLSTQVHVTFKHTPYDQVLLRMDPNGSMKCAFWQFNESDIGRNGAVLYPGQWSEEGCETNFNTTMTVCKCNHLTHFAILLSAQHLKISSLQTLTLQVIGYIGVSTSLVAMAVTTFVLLFSECKLNVIVYKNKPLVTMRNYIHIQLCVMLSIAQIIFVAGIEPHLGEGHVVGGVPVSCRLVAVLLHYSFLVSFMWMLMEGVVLYIALVKIFVRYHARYIAGFTIASYGLPLLYVGGLTVPLGFARNKKLRMDQRYDYGYEQACYLNPATSFVWSFIAPVILILLANIGFLVMTMFIKYRNQKRQHSKGNAKQVWHWLKVSISLTVVMGITWIIGVLVIEVEELFALAFIFTIFVAFQGLFIFVLFVLLSEQVREKYAKWWKAKVAKSDFLSKHFGESTLNVIVLENPAASESLNAVSSADAVVTG